MLRSDFTADVARVNRQSADKPTAQVAMYDALATALPGLIAPGGSGFDGLIQNLIGRLTSLRFFLAKSGG